MMSEIKGIISLLRPWQWVKNGFVLAPVFFGGQMGDVALLWRSFIALICFSLASSAVYCINDIRDVESDRRHPKKCKRPIASGVVKVYVAYGLTLILLAISFFVAYFFLGSSYKDVCIVIAEYIVLNLLYCFWLKRYALIDVFIISIGFVLRLLAGSAVTNVELSHWIVIMTFLLALFLALAKRRDDVVIFEDTGVEPRRNISKYNLAFMNQAISIVGSITIVAYLLYTVSPEVIHRIGSNCLYYTSVFVLLGILRYLQLTIVDVRSGSPTKVLFHDIFTQICVAAWIVSFALILYL